MAYCVKCGRQLPEAAKFCPDCGSATVKDNASEGFKSAVERNVGDITSSFDPADIEKNKVVAGLSYLGFLFFLPLLACPESRFAKFHANQAFMLFVTGIAWSVIGRILNVIPVAGEVIEGLGGLLLAVVMIATLISAFKGKAKVLPVIGKMEIFK